MPVGTGLSGTSPPSPALPPHAQAVVTKCVATPKLLGNKDRRVASFQELRYHPQEATQRMSPSSHGPRPPSRSRSSDHGCTFVSFPDHGLRTVDHERPFASNSTNPTNPTNHLASVSDHGLRTAGASSVEPNELYEPKEPYEPNEPACDATVPLLSLRPSAVDWLSTRL
jgi:hypothetical protein